MSLAVDEVTEVLEAPAHQMEPLSAAPLSQSQPLAAVVRRDEGLTLVLDTARLLPLQIAERGLRSAE